MRRDCESNHTLISPLVHGGPLGIASQGEAINEVPILDSANERCLDLGTTYKLRYKNVYMSDYCPWKKHRIYLPSRRSCRLLY